MQLMTRWYLNEVGWQFSVSSPSQSFRDMIVWRWHN